MKVIAGPPMWHHGTIEEDDRTGLRTTTDYDAAGKIIARHVERMPTDQELRERIAHAQAAIGHLVEEINRKQREVQ